jgi:LuxR family maltose regulon positive regulatory protein
MTTPLLTTKLYIPPPRPNLVERPRLIERLNEGLHRKLTLISAPAGFGKTTLVSEWVAGCERPAAPGPPARTGWLSLDEGDNDPTRFLAYLVAALQTIATNIGEGALGMLQSPQPPPTEAVLTVLINEIAAIPDRVVLVLDDYHIIESSPAAASTSVDGALIFLLEHLPPSERGLHLVIATRDDPHLSLARLRASGQLTELRATDLRFTPDEAATFLNQVMGLSLSADEITALETRTEGWIAGLQMAALSMQGREDTASFIQAFTGSHRFVMDYLVEEVLQRQPERVRSFLLQTSILDRLSGPLCDAVRFGSAISPSSAEGTAVTGQEDGRGMLAALERGNLFVVPLDDRRQWYRYHHLFADVLQAHLMEEQPDQVPTLHRRASEWYEHDGSSADAIRHAIAAEDFKRAAGLVELAWPAMSGSFQSTAWLGWVKALPDELVRARPVLSAAYAWAFLNAGKLEAAEARLLDAERWLDTAPDMSERPEIPLAETCPERSRRMVVVDEEQFRSLPASLAAARAYHAQALGDVPGTVKYARRALDLSSEGDHLQRRQAAALLGIAYWVSGDLESAHKAIADWMNSMQKAGNIVFAIASAFALADIMVAQGRLHEAVRTYKQSLQLASEHNKHVQQVTAHHHLGLAMLYHEMGDQEAAAQHLLKSRELGEQTALVDWPNRWCLAQARLKETQGDLEASLDLLDEAKRLYVRTLVPDIRPIEALKARVYVKQGRLTEALGWAREGGLSADDDLSYLREFEHITLARVLIAQYRSDGVDGSILEAMELLERLLKAAEEGRRMGSVIEILALQALAQEAQGNIPLALAPLERALALAEPEGYVRVFVSEGQPMARLLYEGLSRGIAPDYVRQLSAAFPDIEPDQIGPPKTQVPESELVEPLSEREIEVLQLIAEGLTNQEVATRLYLSLHTVKVHARNIYGKLGVKNRTQAVARGKALGILSHT